MYVKVLVGICKLQNGTSQFGSVFSKDSTAEFPQDPSRELKARELSLLTPFIAINSKDAMAEEVCDYVLVVLALGVLVEVGFEYVLYVGWVCRIDLTLGRSKQSEGSMLAGNIGLEII